MFKISNMKALLAIATIFATISYSQQSEKLYRASHMYLNRTSEYIDDCLKETGATKDMLYTFEKFGDMIADESFKCFLYCMSIKPGVVDEKGTLIPEKLTPIMGITDKKMLDKLNAECGTPTSDDRCNAVQDMILCFVDIFMA